MTTLVHYIDRALREMELYQDLLLVSDEEFHIGFQITDTEESATLILKKKPTVLSGLHDCDFKVTFNNETLQQICKYEKDAFALAGRAKIDDVRPINFEILKGDRVSDAIETIKRLGTYLFIPGRIKIRNIQYTLAGKAHGASPIPLAYWKGFRSAWYFIDDGQILNEAGEKDPWPQLFIALSGKGKVIVADEEFDLPLKKAVYIPPNVTHQIRAEKLVELIWLAWDTPT
jgi:mannose-6-phosphate isomerase-like protein (cupin superfamily)